MRIIGTSETGFLIDLHKDELANIQGFHSAYADGFKVIIGNQIPISLMYNDARTILDTHKEAADAARKLKSAGERFAAYFEEKEPKAKR